MDRKSSGNSILKRKTAARAAAALVLAIFLFGLLGGSASGGFPWGNGFPWGSGMPGGAVRAWASETGAAEDAQGAGTQSGGAGSRESGLTIEVVEELSIDDQVVIEDGEIPLAAFSEAPADAGPRHAAMMGLVLVAAAAYSAYFDRREKELFELRREAARAQKQRDEQ